MLNFLHGAFELALLALMAFCMAVLISPSPGMRWPRLTRATSFIVLAGGLALFRAQLSWTFG